MPISGGMDINKLWYIHTTQYSSDENGSTTPCNNADETAGHNVKQKKIDTKECIWIPLNKVKPGKINLCS